jgi:microcin C transport system substrate-binding protein
MLLKFFICLILPVFAYAAELEKRHGYSVFDDLKYSKDFTHVDYANPDAPKGGTIKFYGLGGFDSLNPFILKGDKATGLGLTFDTLLDQAKDEPNSVYGLVAESLEFPADRSHVIFNLRKEARFHDHTPITAHDLKFSLEILRAKGDPNYQLILKEIKEVEVLDDHRVKYVVTNPKNKQLIYVIGGLPILSQAFFKGKDFAKYSSTPILGSGPYKVKSYQFGKTISYERVKDYWAQDLPLRKGQYNFDHIHYIMFYDTNIAIEAFKSGQYDFRSEISSRVWATEYDIKAVREGRLKKVAIPNKLPASKQFYALNMRRPDFNDINFRKVLTIAFNFEWMNKYLFYNTYRRLESYFDNTEYKATGIPHGKELAVLERYRDKLPEEVFTQEFKYLTNNLDPLKWRADLKEAQRLLSEAGYKLKGDKLISPHTNKPVAITVLTFSDIYNKVLNDWVRNLALLGIDLQIHRVDSAQYRIRMDNFDFDILSTILPGNTAPGNEQKQLWHSSADMKGGYNLSGIHSPVVDDLLDMLTNAQNREEVQTYARALDRVLLWNYYNVLQYYSNEFRVLYWDKFVMPAIKPSYDIGWETWWSKN